MLILPATSAQDARPRFEVASIKMYPVGSPFPTGGGNGVHVSPDGVSARFTRFFAVLEWAYGTSGQVFGPEWIHDRYDIVAKSDGPVPVDQLKAMMRTLLEDRFALKVHRESRDLPVAVLVVAKNGPKNLVSEEAGDPAKYEPANGKLQVKHGSMADLAMFLGNSPPNGVRERVLDQTGLKGVFEISLNVEGFDPKDPAFSGKYDEMQSAAFAFVSLALEKQYGLKLEHRKVPLECLVVDSGNKVPTKN